MNKPYRQQAPTGPARKAKGRGVDFAAPFFFFLSFFTDGPDGGCVGSREAARLGS